MSLKVKQHLDLGNSARIENLAAPINDNDAARKVDISSALEGISWKDAAVVSTQGNIDLSSPGSSIDGITMVQDDRVLVRNQTSNSENGIYIWNGASSQMTRAVFADSTEDLEQAVLSIEEGTNAGVTYRQTQVNFTLDVDDVLWTQFGSAVGNATTTEAGVAEIATQTEVDAGTDDTRIVTAATLVASPYAVKKYSAVIGDGSATVFTLTHNIDSFDVMAKVYKNSDPYNEVLCEIRFKTLNTIEVEFSSAPSSNEYKVAVIG